MAATHKALLIDITKCIGCEMCGARAHMTTPRILCVHGKGSALQELQGTLEKAGYEVLSASDGERALPMLSAQEVDGVILDHHLAGRGGVTLRSLIQHLHPEMPMLLFLRGGRDQEHSAEHVSRVSEKPGPPDTLFSVAN
jgi:DNA-binding NtrC family response regulator